MRGSQDVKADNPQRSVCITLGLVGGSRISVELDRKVRVKGPAYNSLFPPFRFVFYFCSFHARRQGSTVWLLFTP
jgi:hypothetical protein